MAVVNNVPSGLRRGIASSPNFNGTGQRPKSSIPTGQNANKVSSKLPSPPQSLGLLGPICWRVPPVSPGDCTEVDSALLSLRFLWPFVLLFFHIRMTFWFWNVLQKKIEDETGGLVLEDRPLRNSDSSQTWSSEDNDTSDADGTENEGPTANGKEPKGGVGEQQETETGS